MKEFPIKLGITVFVSLVVLAILIAVIGHTNEVESDYKINSDVGTILEIEHK